MTQFEIDIQAGSLLNLQMNTWLGKHVSAVAGAGGMGSG